jgi:hypothetical protein
MPRMLGLDSHLSGLRRRSFGWLVRYLPAELLGMCAALGWRWSLQVGAPR